MQDIFFITVTLATVSIVNTIIIFVINRFMVQANQRYDAMLMASIFLSIALCLFVFDVYYINRGINSLILTFFVYAFLAQACTKIVNAVARTYNFQESINLLTTTIVTLLISIVATLATHYHNYVLREIVLLYIVLSSFGFIVYYLIKNKVHIRTNLYFYQSIILLLLAFIDLIRLLKSGDSVLHGVNTYGYLLLALGYIILITFQTTYLVEIQRIQSKYILQKNHDLINTVEEVTLLSELDPLTQLFNRRKVFAEIEAIVKYYEGKQNCFSVIIADVNDLKIINDNFGHNVGDDALCFIANLLKDNIRENDILGRYGGDEFIIVLLNISASKLKKVVETLKLKLEMSIFPQLDKPVSLAIGYSTYRMNQSIKEVIAEADSLMYVDKELMKSSM